jgi:hypothetical protein
LALTRIHLVSIPVTNTSVDPERSPGVARTVLPDSAPSRRADCAFRIIEGVAGVTEHPSAGFPVNDGR